MSCTCFYFGSVADLFQKGIVKKRPWWLKAVSVLIGNRIHWRKWGTWFIVHTIDSYNHWPSASLDHHNLAQLVIAAKKLKLPHRIILTSNWLGRASGFNTAKKCQVNIKFKKQSSPLRNQRNRNTFGCDCVWFFFHAITISTILPDGLKSLGFSADVLHLKQPTVSTVSLTLRRTI